MQVKEYFSKQKLQIEIKLGHKNQVNSVINRANTEYLKFTLIISNSSFQTFLNKYVVTLIKVLCICKIDLKLT